MPSEAACFMQLVALDTRLAALAEHSTSKVNDIIRLRELLAKAREHLQDTAYEQLAQLLQRPKGTGKRPTTP